MRKPVAMAFLGMLLSAMPVAAPPPTETAVSVSVTPGLSLDAGIRTVLADPRAKDVIAKYAPTVVEFFTPGPGLAPAETPLAALAPSQMAIDADLTAENIEKISDELAGC